MALAEYNKLVWFPSGELARNVPARVFPENSNVLAPLFTDATGTTPAPNPISTTAGGQLVFWVEEGEYWIHMDSESIEVTVPDTGPGVSPSGTVVTETSYGQASAPGAAAAYSRGDHTHGTPALPPVGTTPGTYAAGDDARFTDARTPTGPAGGDLAGTYPDPDVAAVNGVAVTGIPAAGQLLTATGAAAAQWQDAPAGGTDPTASVRITDDNLSGLPAAVAWAIVVTSGATQLKASIAAAVGDRIEVHGRFMRKGGHFLDWVILTGAGAIDEYSTTGTGTPPAEGDPALYPSLSFAYETGAPMFVVGAEHIDGSGNVTVALAHQGASTGNANIVYAHPTYPFRLRLKNIGPE